MSTQLIRVLFYEKMRDPQPSKNPVCLVLGAGADISSGGLTFAEVKRTCIEHFGKTSLPSFLSADEINTHFNEFFDTLVSEKERAPVLDYLFHGMKTVNPSDGYKLLVLLAKAGVINAVITTNFDTTLEAAQEALGLDVFQIYAPGVASPYLAGGVLFLPPRPLYIKLHGDIRAKRITHLTSQDSGKRRYDKNFSCLIRSIAQTHTLVFVGYSGNDEVFAYELKKVASRIPDPVYWCSPSGLGNGNPLQQVFEKQKVIEIKATFENLLNDAGAYPLRNFTLSETEPHFLLPLLNDRIAFANEQFMDSYEFADISTRLAVLQTRHSKLDQLAAFRVNAEKPLAVVTGLSGVGKTTLICQLLDAEAEKDSQKLLILRARGLISTDFAESLILRLGYSANNPFSLLYDLSIWLRNRETQLLVVVDGLNEFDWRSRGCLDLFNEILRVALWTQPHNSLKFLITMRPETWNEIYSTAAHDDLRRVLWNSSEFKDDLRTLHLEPFSEKEMASAYRSYANFFGVTTPYRQLSETAKSQLADPYFLALSMKNGGAIDPSYTSFRLYDQILRDALGLTFGISKSRSVDNSLLRLASIGLDRAITDFPLDVLESLGITHEELRCLLEIPILQKNEAGRYCFAHDRIHEYFLSRSISELEHIQVRDKEEFSNAIEAGGIYPRLKSALQQSILSASPSKREHYLRLVMSALEGKSTIEGLTPTEKNTVDFSHGVLLGLSMQTPEILVELVNSYLNTTGNNAGQDPILWRIMLRCLVFIPADKALLLFRRMKDKLGGEFQREASVLIFDKVTDYFLQQSNGKDGSFFSGEVFTQCVVNPQDELWENVFRVIQLITRIGPDNTHPDEWSLFSANVSNLLDQLCQGLVHTKVLESAVAEAMMRNANVLLFNASPEILEHFFMNPGRRELEDVLSKVEGGALTLELVLRCRRFITTLDQNIEFTIMNLLFVISMKNDREKTLQLFSDYYATFDSQTSTEELDFFLSCLSISHLALGLECQEIVGDYTCRMLDQLPQVSSGYPGAFRGERRGLFTDPFEQQFEDGFNPLAFYFYNAPSRYRRSQRYADYLTSRIDQMDPIPLYWEFLARYEVSGNQLGIIRIVHVLGQMINIWPIEGLIAVEKLIGRTEPTIRRALIRVLAEANARFPRETSRMLSRAGAGFSEEEKYEIYWARTSHMGHRPLEQVEWARVMFFFDQRDGSGHAFLKLARALTTSFSLPEALGRIISEVIVSPKT